MVISGKLPNDTVWWLSTDGLKIWIESKDLEQEKFKEKGFYIVRDNIYRAKKHVGELTTSRLDSRRYKDAWIIKLDAIADVYPELIYEIDKKQIEEKKKKKVAYRNYKNRTKKVEYKPIREELNSRAESIKDELSPIKDELNSREESIKDEFKPNIDENKNSEIIKDNVKTKESKSDYFDINKPYVIWIKDEIDKSNGKLRINLKDLKEKMGNEFINMHDLRIYFGLKKILPNIGISIDLITSKGESIVIMNKTNSE